MYCCWTSWSTQSSSRLLKLHVMMEKHNQVGLQTKDKPKDWKNIFFCICILGFCSKNMNKSSFFLTFHRPRPFWAFFYDITICSCSFSLKLFFVAILNIHLFNSTPAFFLLLICFIIINNNSKLNLKLSKKTSCTFYHFFTHKITKIWSKRFFMFITKIECVETK